MRRSLAPWRGQLAPRSLFSDLDSMFDSFFADWEPAGMQAFHPHVDVQERDDSFLICADLPGVNKNDIHLECKDNILTLSGERRYEKDENEEGYRRSERAYGHFERRFQLPEMVEAEKIQARHENGVLEILIPKKGGGASRQIEVESGKSGLFSKLVGKSEKGRGEKKEPTSH